MDKLCIKKKRACYPSARQKRRLLELLKADPELGLGKFSPHFTKTAAQNRWRVISDELNAIPGARKSWSEWRKTYQDKKSKTKKKASEQDTSDHQTREGDTAEETNVVLIEELNEDIKPVFASISEDLISEQSDGQESAVIFNEKMKATSKKYELDTTKEALDLQKALTEENLIKKEYYKQKIEQMKRQADALELIARSIASRSSPYI